MTDGRHKAIVMAQGMAAHVYYIKGCGSGVALAVALWCGALFAQESAEEVDEELIRSTVESVAATVEMEYFDADVAARAGASLRSGLAEGRFSSARTVDSLAALLSGDLFAVTGDKHLTVAARQAEPADEQSPAEQSRESRQKRGERENFGVQRIEVLPGNVGYLNLTAFYRPGEVQETISNAMRALRSANALILDLRSNTGGSPESVALVASYFFDEPALPLFEIVARSGDVRRYATQNPAPPERNAARPLYVLTSARTFSAGEGLAFLLQERQRATIVGEQTAGAANPGRPYPVNARFEVTVPNGRVVTDVRRGNWEGSGVTPDVLVPASQALDAVQARIASRRLAQDERQPERAGVVQAEFIYEVDSAPTPQCHASTIAETADGLVAAWFGGTHEKHDDVGIWFSRREGQGWSSPVRIADGVVEGRDYPCWNPVLFQPAGGPLLLFYKVGPSPSTWWGVLTTSGDGGRTWGEHRRLPNGILGPVKNRPLQLGDGSILCGSSSEHDDWRVHLEWTADLGRTWHRTPPLNHGDEFGAIQPGMLQHDRTGRRLQILCRSEQGRIVESRSDDSGRTWTPLAATSLPNPNSGLDALTLADGRALVVYNHTPRGRSPLNVAVSDDGRDWQAAAVLEDEPGEYSYPAVIQARDGTVHITYTWKRRLVRHVSLDPDRFRLRPIEGGEWPK